MTYPDMVICLAVYFVTMYPRDISLAAEEFCKACMRMGYDTPKNVTEFMRTWADRATPEGNIERHAHLSGRRRALTPAMVKRAYKGLTGWRAANRARPYRTREEAQESCPEVKAVQDEAGVTFATLLRAIKEEHPGFGRHKLTLHWTLSATHKRERVRVSTQLKARSARAKLLVVHLDAKSIPMMEEEAYGYVDANVNTSVERIKPAYHNNKLITLRYYAAVNALLGPILLVFYTGTTGMDANHDGNNYKVRSGCE